LISDKQIRIELDNNTSLSGKTAEARALCPCLLSAFGHKLSPPSHAHTKTASSGASNPKLQLNNQRKTREREKEKKHK